MTVLLLTGCMTDPNGDTCVWSPGNDGFCPSDSGGSSTPHTTTYLSGTGVAEGDHVRVAMTRSETGERPHIETAVVLAGIEPEHAAVRLHGDAMPGTVAPQLAAIDDRVFIAWDDLYAGAMVVAPLHEDGTVAGAEIVNLGADRGSLRRVGDRLLFVSMNQSGEVRGTWLDHDGRVGTTEVLATNVTSWLDVSSDGASGAIAMTYFTFDKTTMTHALVVARIAADGSRRETPIPRMEKDFYTYLQVTGTSDGGALAMIGLQRDGQTMPSLIRVNPDGTTRFAPAEVPAAVDLVRNGDVILALSAASTISTQARVLDEAGTVKSGPFALDAFHITAFATGDGFTLIHESNEAPVAATSLDASGFPAPPIAIAKTEVDGCGCRTANPPTAGLFAIVMLFVVRRRVRRAA